MQRFMGDEKIRRRISLSAFLNLEKVLKNSSLGEIAFIWKTERVQIDAIKFEGMQINFLCYVFIAVIVVVAQAPCYFRNKGIFPTDEYYREQ